MNNLKGRVPDMPQTALQKAAMTPSELQRLIEESVEAGTPLGDLADKLGYTRQHFWQLRTGKTPITKRCAHIIRTTLKPRK